MKNLMICIVLLTFVYCQKGDKELPRDKFLGQWKAFDIVTKEEISTSVSAGSKENFILWSIKGESVELELIGKNDTFAFQTNFSVPIFIDNSASLKFINKDSLYGIRTVGSIFFPSSYTSDQYHLTK